MILKNTCFAFFLQKFNLLPKMLRYLNFLAHLAEVSVTKEKQ